MALVHDNMYVLGIGSRNKSDMSCEVNFNQYTNFLHFNSTCVEDENKILAVNVVNSFYMVVNLLIGVISISSNLFVLVILVWNLKRGQNYVLVSLACCDLLGGVNIVSAELQNFWYDNVNSGLPCVLTAFLYVLAYGCQNFSLLLLTIDRWISISHPLRCRAILSKKKLKLFIAAIWIFWLILSGGSTINNKWTVGSSCHPFAIFRSWAVVAILVPVLVTFFTIMVFYGMIHGVAVRHSRAIRDVSLISSSFEDQMYVHEAKSLRVVRYILGVFYGSWAALLIQEVIKRLPSHSFWPALLQYVSRDFFITLFFSSSVMNTVVYHYNCTAFREAMAKTLCPTKHREDKRQQALLDLGLVDTAKL